MPESRRVYSTADGDLRKRCGTDRPAVPALQGDGIVRVSRETSGRRGKAATVVRGLPASRLPAIASDLKRLCGSGGTVKDDVVELQGDHRGKVVARLEAQGFRVELAGG